MLVSDITRMIVRVRMHMGKRLRPIISMVTLERMILSMIVRVSTSTSTGASLIMLTRMSMTMSTRMVIRAVKVNIMRMRMAAVRCVALAFLGY